MKKEIEINGVKELSDNERNRLAAHLALVWRKKKRGYGLGVRAGVRAGVRGLQDWTGWEIGVRCERLGQG